MQQLFSSLISDLPQLLTVIAIIVVGGVILLRGRNSTGGLTLFGLAGLVITAIFLLVVLADGALEYAIPALLIIVSIAVFVLLMIWAAHQFHSINIADVAQPFGLPSGTIRAVLTIAFVVLIGVFGTLILSLSQNRQGLVPVTGMADMRMPAGDANRLQTELGPDYFIAKRTNDADPVANARRWARHYVYLAQQLMD